MGELYFSVGKNQLILIFVSITAFQTILSQTFGDGVQNPSVSSVEANFDCKTSKLIKSIGRTNLIESRGAKCNQIKREHQNIELNLLLRTQQNITVNASGSTYIYDYGGIRTVIFNGQVDSTSPFCGQDRLVLYEKALPKKGNCVKGIILHEALSSFVRIGGVCDSFCSGKTVTQHIRPLGPLFLKNE